MKQIIKDKLREIGAIAKAWRKAAYHGQHRSYCKLDTYNTPGHKCDCGLDDLRGIALDLEDKF